MLAGSNGVLLVPQMRFDHGAGGGSPGVTNGRARLAELPRSARVRACSLPVPGPELDLREPGEVDRPEPVSHGDGAVVDVLELPPCLVEPVQGEEKHPVDKARAQSPRQLLAERPLELLCTRDHLHPCRAEVAPGQPAEARGERRTTPRTLGQLHGLAAAPRCRVPTVAHPLLPAQEREDLRAQLEILARLGESTFEEGYRAGCVVCCVTEEAQCPCALLRGRELRDQLLEQLARPGSVPDREEK